MNSKWKMVRLGDDFELQMGKTPDRKNDTYWNTGENLWVSIADMTNCSSKYIATTKETISNSAITSMKPVPKGTVIMSFKLSIGKVCIANVDLYTNEAIMAFLPRREYYANFLYYRLLSFAWTEGLNKAVKGITLNKASISNTRMLFPSFERQKQIAATLDKASQLISLRKKQLKELDALAESVFYDMFGDPVKNEKGWKMIKIKDLTKKEKNALKAGPFGSSLKKEFYTETGYKIYGQEQVLSGDPFSGDYYISREKYLELESCAIKENDVLISLVGSYGKTLIIPKSFIPGIINPRLLKISFDMKLINPEFFRFVFSTKSYQNSLSNITHGGTMPILNLGVIKELKIPTPSLPHQTHFATLIEKIESQKTLVRKSLQESEDLFQRLMQDLFNPN